VACEVSVRLKDEEKTLTVKHLIYDDFVCNENDPILKQCINDSIKQFTGHADDIQVKITLEVL